jgi:hypothetical protein
VGAKGFQHCTTDPGLCRKIKRGGQECEDFPYAVHAGSQLRLLTFVTKVHGCSLAWINSPQVFVISFCDFLCGVFFPTPHLDVLMSPSVRPHVLYLKIFKE